MGLVVRTLKFERELELHRAHLAAVVHGVERLAEAVEALGRVDDRPQAEVRDGRAPRLGHEREPDAVVAGRRGRQAGATEVPASFPDVRTSPQPATSELQDTARATIRAASLVRTRARARGTRGSILLPPTAAAGRPSGRGMTGSSRQGKPGRSIPSFSMGAPGSPPAPRPDENRLPGRPLRRPGASPLSSRSRRLEPATAVGGREGTAFFLTPERTAPDNPARVRPEGRPPDRSRSPQPCSRHDSDP